MEGSWLRRGIRGVLRSRGLALVQGKDPERA